MRPRQIRKLLSIALGLIVLGSLWFYFAPAQLGGSTTYVVTHGISMEPRFHTGDLALVRSQSSYHVGEIVAYHNKMLHTIVLHRIVGRDGSRYIFKGDNNNYLDFEHPAASQLIGALWIHIHGAGAVLQSIRSPALVGILIAAGILLLTGAAFKRRRRLRGRERRTGEGNTQRHAHSPQHADNSVVGLLSIGLIALLPFVALALLAFTRATSERLPYKIPYKQSGTFSYSANAAPGPVYPDNRAVTGDPLFTHVLSAADLRFAYAFQTAARHSLAGKASLVATVTSTSGWQTTLALGAPTHFRGDHALATGTLDLTSLLALLRNVEDTTKTRGSYTLTITPNVSVSGVSDLGPIHTTFAPEMKFSLEEAEIRPAASSSSALAAAAPATNQFAPSSSGVVTGARDQPMYLSLVLVRLSVATARTIALVAIAVLVAVLLAILALLRPVLALRRARPGDEAASIRTRYGRLIVPVAHVAQLPGVAVIDVADMDALVRIADHYDRSILHETSAAGDAFWITDESGQFRYALSAQAPVAAVQADAVAAPTDAGIDDTGEVASMPAPAAAAPYGVDGRMPGEPRSAWEEVPTSEFTAVHLATNGPSYVAPPSYPAAQPVAAQTNGTSHAPAPDIPAAQPVTAQTNGTSHAPAPNIPAAQPVTAQTNGTSHAPAPDIPAAQPVTAQTNGTSHAASPTFEFELPLPHAADEVYEDELELAVIGYEPSRTGRANRSNTSASLPAWTGS
ncbi:MAG TPA: signal peptidase I [Solirubrobacteraceae bacterium]|nr:signal peptidase I [Solirubrobacteraceae bacterium]